MPTPPRSPGRRNRKPPPKGLVRDEAEAERAGDASHLDHNSMVTKLDLRDAASKPPFGVVDSRSGLDDEISSESTVRAPGRRGGGYGYARGAVCFLFPSVLWVDFLILLTFVGHNSRLPSRSSTAHYLSIQLPPESARGAPLSPSTRVAGGWRVIFFFSCVQQIPLPVIVAALLRVVSSGTSRASRLAALRDLDDRIKRSTSTLTSFGSSEALVSPVGSNSSRSVVRSLATGTGVSALSAGSDGPKVNTGSSKVTLDEVYPRLVTATYVMLGKAAPWAGLMTRICSTRCCCCCCCCCWFALVWNCRRENREGDPRDGASNLGLVAITCGE